MSYTSRSLLVIVALSVPFTAQTREPKPSGEVYTEEKGENPFAGRSALFVSGKHRVLEVPHNIRAAFQSYEQIATIEVRRFGKSVRSFDIFLCRNYRTLPL